MSEQKKFYKNPVLLPASASLALALFLYGAYSFFYEFLRWTNFPYIILNAAIMALMTFALTWLAVRCGKEKPASVKQAIVKSLISTAVQQVVMWGLLTFINVVIYHESENRLAIDITYVFTFLQILITVIILFKNALYDSRKGKKAFYGILAGVMSFILVAAPARLVAKHMTFYRTYPIYRAFTDMGGVESGDYRYDFALSTEKVLPTDNLGKDSTASISLAKNEYEGVQFTIAADKNNKEVKILVTDFTGESGTIKTAVYKEIYTSVKMFGSTFTDKFPDALVPYDGENTELNKNRSQTFYIEIKSDKETPAGDYKAMLTAADGEGNVITEREITAHVWDFTVPEKPSMETAMGLASSNFWQLNGFDATSYGWNGVYGADLTEEQRELYLSYYNYLIEHRISPYVLPYDILDERADAYMSDERVTSFTVPYTDDDAKLTEYYNKISSNPVWASKAYYYPIDEPNDAEAYAKYTEMTDRLARLCPGYNMVTPFCTASVEMDGTEQSAVSLQQNRSSILCAISDIYDKNEFELDKHIDEAVAAGSRSWWYVCCGPQGDYCNFFIRHEGLKHRLLFWQQKTMDVTGLLYWNTAYWDKANPWESSKTWDSYEAAGDGCLVYPGKPVGVNGPVGTLRITNITDGLEDYEYFTLAESLLGREYVNGIIGKAVTSMTEYTSDDALFASVRTELGEAIEKAS